MPTLACVITGCFRYSQLIKVKPQRQIAWASGLALNQTTGHPVGKRDDTDFLVAFGKEREMTG
jgi:hypothetical protein